MSGEAQSKFSLGKIKVPKASEILTNFLREKILDGAYAAGESLPTERELAILRDEIDPARSIIGRTTAR